MSSFLQLPSKFLKFFPKRSSLTKEVAILNSQGNSLYENQNRRNVTERQRTSTSSVLTFSAELALLLAGAAAAGRALARTLVLALPASDQHFPQLPSQRLEGSVIGRENSAGVRRAAAAHVHKPQLARSRAGCIV